MDETNAKREARRRRILENSENRLRKITGRINSVETKDNDLQVEAHRVKTQSNYQHDIIRTAVYNTNNTSSQDYIKSDDEHEGFLNDVSNENVYLSEVSKSKSMLYILLFKRINFVLLAGIINILLLLELDKLFGQAILVPYLLLAVGHLYRYTTRLHDYQNGSLLVAALLLCNIKPKIIYMFKLLITLFTVIISDFSLFMFNFVLMRYIIIRCYYYEATLPNAYL